MEEKQEIPDGIVVPYYLKGPSRDHYIAQIKSVGPAEDLAEVKIQEQIAKQVLDNDITAEQLRRMRGETIEKRIVGEAIADAVKRAVASYAAQMAQVVQMVPPNLRNDASAIIESARPIAAAAALAEDQAG